MTVGRAIRIAGSAPNARDEGGHDAAIERSARTDEERGARRVMLAFNVGDRGFHWRHEIEVQRIFAEAPTIDVERDVRTIRRAGELDRRRIEAGEEIGEP